MKKKLLQLAVPLCLLVILLLSGSVQAQCHTEETILTRLQSGLPDTYLVHKIEGQAAQDYIERYNAAPPASNYQADEILIFGSSKRSGYFQAFTVDGCMVAYGMVSKEVVSRLLGIQTGRAI
jgi:hypothetical protein